MTQEDECPCCARAHLFIGEVHDAARALYYDTFTVIDDFQWEYVWEGALGSKDPEACIQLVCAMSEVSENYDCSSWGSGLADMLAEKAKDIEGSCVERCTDFFQVERKALRNLLALSEKCGGWWDWEQNQFYRSFVPGWVPPAPRPKRASLAARLEEARRGPQTDPASSDEVS